MEKKYEMTEERLTLNNGTVLHRIQALKDFDVVKKGEFGGFIEKEENLSHEGDCWIYDDALVYGNARVCNNARVHECATIYDNALVYNSARVRGNAKVRNNARVYGCALVYGYALVCDNSEVCGDALVHGNAEIYGCAEVYDIIRVYNNAKVCGYARVSNGANISSTNDVLCVGPIGSRNDYTTFYKSIDNHIMVDCGWFNDTIDVFEEQVKIVHNHNAKYIRQYITAIDFAKANLI